MKEHEHIFITPAKICRVDFLECEEHAKRAERKHDEQ